MVRMTEAAFRAYCTARGYAEKTFNYINDRIRNAAPSRNVRANARNRAGLYASFKMGVMIQWESARVEGIAVPIYEARNAVIEYYDQPEAIELRYLIPSKKDPEREVLHKHLYTPDFFVIYRDHAGWEEWRTERHMEELAKKSPKLYDKEGEKWRCPPAEEFAASYGLTYVIRTPSELNETFVANFEFLKRYYHSPREVASDIRESLVQYVADHPATNLEELFDAGFEADDIYALLAENSIYTDLEAVRLDNKRRVLFFRDISVARAFALTRVMKPISAIGMPQPVRIGTRVAFAGDEWTIAEFTSSKVLLVRKDGEQMQPFSRDMFEMLRKDNGITVLRSPESSGEHLEIIKSAGPKALEKALKDAEVVSQALAGRKAKDLGVPERTLRRKKRKLEEQGFLGLVPRHDRRGNRNPRDYIDEEAIRRGIEEFYETPIRPSITATAEYIQEICRCKGTHEPSYETIRRRIHARDQVEQIEAREGHKARNAAETVMPDGPRPFIDIPLGRVHIDHTKMDIETIDRRTGLKHKSTRVWITRAVDECTRVTIARFLSRLSPCYVSVMRVLKRIGEKYGRLPATIVIDGGSEFRSEAFGVLLARYNVKTERRRSGNGSDGWPVERSFGSLNTEFLYRLPGNTQAARNVRQMTPRTNPKNQDLLTLEELEERLDSYLEEYHNTPHDGLDGESPFQKWDRIARFAGTVSDNDITDIDEFKILILPPVSGGGTRTVTRQGIKVENTWYVCHQMQAGTMNGHTVPVKEDPDNRGHVMIYLGNCWVEARSRDFFELSTMTPEERAIESEEILARRSEIKWRKREYKSSRSPESHKNPAIVQSDDTATPMVQDDRKTESLRNQAIPQAFRLPSPKKLEEIR